MIPIVKQSREIIPVSFNFGDTLDTSETVTDIEIIAYDAVETNVTSTVVSNKSTVGSIVYFQVKNGTDGQRYKITAIATTSTGNKYEQDVFMRVEDV